MKRVKGCLNSSCKEYKKTYYKESEETCPKCGTKLSYVCKHPKCFKQIPDNVREQYCPVHLAEKQDKKEKLTDKVVKVCKGSVVGIVTIVGVTKTVISIMRKK